MRKRTIITLALLLASVVSMGQIRISNDRSVRVSRRVSMGVKLGVNDAVMEYTDKEITSLKHTHMLKPIGGIYVELPVLRFFSVSPELMFIQRGTIVEWSWLGHPTTYTLNARYLDFRIPLQFYWPVSNVFKPYVYVSPDFGYVLGGNITIDQPGGDMGSKEIAIGRANMKSFDMGLVLGIGFRFDVKLEKRYIYVKVEGAYNRGLLNTFSEKELEDNSQSANVNAYNVSGARYNRGYEVMISVGMPFYKKGETCSYFRKQRRNRW